MTWFSARPHFTPCVIAGVMSLLALADWPYGYYQLLRLVVTATAVYVVVLAVKSKQMWAVWTYCLVALTFNPVVPLHLARGVWSVLNVVAALTLLAAVLAVRLPFKRADGAS